MTLVRKRHVLIVLVLAALFVALMLQRGTQSPVRASDGVPIYGTCTGAKQGLIKGGVTAKGHTGQYAISALSHELTLPTDPESGLANGRIQSKPVTFTMDVDRASPEFVSALATNELLKTCTFNFYKTTSGKQTNTERIKLTNAGIIDYKFSGHQSSDDTITLSLDWQKLEVEWVPDGIISVLDWQTPVD
jgi:type VI secretion system secreted protein Hcp